MAETEDNETWTYAAAKRIPGRVRGKGPDRAFDPGPVRDTLLPLLRAIEAVPDSTYDQVGGLDDQHDLSDSFTHLLVAIGEQRQLLVAAHERRQPCGGAIGHGDSGHGRARVHAQRFGGPPRR